MATLLQTIAQDLNRSLLHGARQKSSDEQILPATVLDGRQAPTTVEQLTQGVQLLYQADPKGNLIPQPGGDGDVGKTHAAVTAALEDPGTYFSLSEEKQIPDWIYQQKIFSLPAKPAPEDTLAVGDRKLVRLPAGVLREAALQGSVDTMPPPAPVSLCKVITKKRENASFQQLDPLDQKQWQFALLLRCPIDPAWDKGGNVPVFELGGIPQSERWYLDWLGLLEDLGKKLTAPRVRLWIEKPLKPNQTEPDRIEITQWVIARRNLTGLARPGTDSLAADEAVVNYPYAVTEANSEDTLRLAQMASITNSGGYYLQAYQAAAGGDLNFAPEPHTLILVQCFPNTAAQEGVSAVQLPPYANAAIFPKEAQQPDPANPLEPSVVRFEGLKHVVSEPYAPAGCVSFGWRQALPAIVDKTKDFLPSSKVGFARSIHLLDYDVKDGNQTPILQWQEQVKWTQDNTTGEWKRSSDSTSEACIGNSGPALSPVKPLPGQDEQNARIAALRMDIPPAASDEHGEDEPPNPSWYYYRVTVRFAQDADGFGYLNDAKLRNLTMRAGLRDIYGNRLLQDLAAQSKKIYYTDSLVPPGEWPGFAFAIYPSAPGRVTLQMRYSKPQKSNGGVSADPNDIRRQLTRIQAQIKGASDDIAIDLDDPVFSFTLAQGNPSIKQALLPLLASAVTGAETAEPQTPPAFDVAFKDGIPMDRPYLFTPSLVVRRTNLDYLPADGYPADPDLQAAIKEQISKAVATMTLAAKAFDANSNTAGVFGDIANNFATLIAPQLHCQAAMRRNRFNEHELWFAPNAIFPKARTEPPVFSTPRPMSNTLGADSFPIPDFATTQSVAKWRDFPLTKTNVAKIDFDLVGRRVFNLLETLSNPTAITSRAPSPDQPQSGLLWAQIMAAKDGVATYLGDPGNGYIQSFFVQTRDAARPEGIQRMAQDAFQRDLRLFYGVDALVQWPLDVQPIKGGVTNFYGKSQPVIDPATPPQPAFSDFVLNAKQDSGGTGLVGRLTVTYNLPTGEGGNFKNWKTSSYTAQITHLQLPVPGESETYIFNQGEWLELVAPQNSKDVTALTYATPVTVPAVVRNFPNEPSIPATQPVTSIMGIPNNPFPLPEELAGWGWQVQIDTDDVASDILYLEVAYNADEASSKSQDDVADASDDWEAKSLLQALVVLGKLADLPASKWTESNGQRALEALPYLLGNLLRQLRRANAPATAADGTVQQKDYFTLPLSALKELTAAPGNWVAAKDVVATIEHSGDFPEHQIPKNVARVTVGPARIKDSQNQDKLSVPLRLFGTNAAWNYRPGVRLKRNYNLVDGLDTTPSLVYECGPVYFSGFVPVANRWTQITIVEVASQSQLSDALKDSMEKILGKDATLASYLLRLDCKHAFNIVGDTKAINPFAIFPADYNYTSTAKTATDITRSYANWLGGSSPADLLSRIPGAAFLLGIQVARRDAVNRVLLEVEALSFDATKASP
jgi:hypothetical protein